jgi:hypothetical protein
VEHQGLLAVKAARRSFALREVQPDGMLVVGDNIVHGDPEGTSRTSATVPKKPSIWSMPWYSPATEFAAGLMEDCIVGNHRSERIYVAVGEGIVASSSELLVGMGHGRDLLSAEVATLFLSGWRRQAQELSAGLAGGSWPVTRRDPALGTKTDSEPESQRTVINRSSTAVTTPLRVRVPTFSDSTSIRSPTSTIVGLLWMVTETSHPSIPKAAGSIQDAR